MFKILNPFYSFQIETFILNCLGVWSENQWLVVCVLFANVFNIYWFCICIVVLDTSIIYAVFGLKTYLVSNSILYNVRFMFVI